MIQSFRKAILPRFRDPRARNDNWGAKLYVEFIDRTISASIHVGGEWQQEKEVQNNDAQDLGIIVPYQERVQRLNVIYLKLVQCYSLQGYPGEIVIDKCKILCPIIQDTEQNKYPAFFVLNSLWHCKW